MSSPHATALGGRPRSLEITLRVQELAGPGFVSENHLQGSAVPQNLGMLKGGSAEGALRACSSQRCSEHPCAPGGAFPEQFCQERGDAAPARAVAVLETSKITAGLSLG